MLIDFFVIALPLRTHHNCRPNVDVESVVSLIISVRDAHDIEAHSKGDCRNDDATVAVTAISKNHQQGVAICLRENSRKAGPRWMSLIVVVAALFSAKNPY